MMILDGSTGSSPPLTTYSFASPLLTTSTNMLTSARQSSTHCSMQRGLVTIAPRVKVRGRWRWTVMWLPLWKVRCFYLEYFYLSASLVNRNDFLPSALLLMFFSFLHIMQRSPLPHRLRPLLLLRLLVCGSASTKWPIFVVWWNCSAPVTEKVLWRRALSTPCCWSVVWPLLPQVRFDLLDLLDLFVLWMPGVWMLTCSVV